jgi:hypothetical protein
MCVSGDAQNREATHKIVASFFQWMNAATKSQSYLHVHATRRTRTLAPSTPSFFGDRRSSTAHDKARLRRAPDVAAALSDQGVGVDSFV